MGVGRYLFPEGLLEVAHESRSPVDFAPPVYGGVWGLDDGRFVLVEHLPNEDKLRFAKGAFKESIPPKSYDFRFLPDGRHLFKTAPKMGKDESNFFIDVIEGQTVTLSYVTSPGAEPKKLAARPQFLSPDFVMDGANIVYWAPGRVDEPKNERRLQLESVDVATGKVTGLGTLVTPALVDGPSGKLYQRGTPTTHHYVHSRFVVHAAGFDAQGRSHAVRVVDVAAATSNELQLAQGEELLGCLSAAHGILGASDRRRDDDVLILSRPSDSFVQMRVLTLPDLVPLFSVTVPTMGPVVADFVRDP